MSAATFNWRAISRFESPGAGAVGYELGVIAQAQLADFFLHVAHLMAYAARQGIARQRRGSAGNSMVTYLLGITPVDPLAHGLLFRTLPQR
ncbi:MAG: hypothetical protein R2911_39220 [Caldilineaceae bacterium]